MLLERKIYIPLLLFITTYICWQLYAPELIHSMGSNILSLAGSGGATLIGWLYLKSYPENEDKILLQMIWFCCLFYFVGDLTWFSHELTMGESPEIWHVNTLFYVLSTASLVVGPILFFKNMHQKWTNIRLVVDTLIIVTMIGYGMYHLLDHTILAMIDTSLDSMVMIFYIISDIAIIVVVLINLQWRKLAIFRTIVPLLILQVAWAITDFMYTFTYLSFDSEYFLIIDALWVIALVGFALLIRNRAMNMSMHTQVTNTQELNQEKGWKNTRLITFVYILSTLAVLPVWTNVIVLTLIFCTYIIGLRYIGTYEKNERLMLEYSDLNTKLNVQNEQLMHNNTKLDFFANYDALTGLPNRRYFENYIDKLCAEQQPFAIMFLDLDRFKSINDWYGHDIGDELLKILSDELKKRQHETEFYARLGGDEFVCILKNISSQEQLTQKANAIIEKFNRQFKIKKLNIDTSFSIGGALYPSDGKVRVELLKHADIALYRAKNSGRNRACIYDCQMNQQEYRKLEIENQLMGMFHNNEAYVQYQPLMNMKTGELSSVEALIRWQSPILGTVNPLEFIGIAEETGFIHVIGEFVIQRACRDIMRFNLENKTNICVSINVSPLQFSNRSILQHIQTVIDQGMNPKWIILEITESIILQDTDIIEQVMEQLRDQGIKLYVDDYGTGYSSLSYLKKYPIRALKIDKSLVDDLELGDNHISLVQGIISLCSDLRIEVVAEGIETLGQIEQLKQMGCDYGQGYFISRPKAMGELAMNLDAKRFVE